MQKLISLTYHDGALGNFLHTPGSIDSLARHISDGWRVVSSNVDREETRGFFVLEKPDPSEKRLEIAAMLMPTVIVQDRFTTCELQAGEALRLADALIAASRGGK